MAKALALLWFGPASCHLLSGWGWEAGWEYCRAQPEQPLPGLGGLSERLATPLPTLLANSLWTP